MSGKGKGKSRYDGKGALAKQAKATKSAAAMPASASQEIVEPELETGAMIADAAMPIQHCHTLTLTIRAPFLFPGVAAGWFGVDRVALRDHKGQIIIPQDQVRGVLRDGLRLLGYVDLVKDLFGYGSAASAEVLRLLSPRTCCSS